MSAGTGNWGRTNRRPRTITPFRPSRMTGSVLPYGNGRSYGDSCHNDSGTLLDARQRRQILAFDTESGLLRVEAGAMLGNVLARLEGSGWFMPVVPGTRHVTFGGMLANDIHGKNHEHRGTFGCHVRSLTLHRSDRGSITCSPGENADLFAATIGGMGLTGFVTQMDVQLMAVPSSHVRQTNKAFGSIGEAIDILANNDTEYSVAWVDSIASGRRAGRGVMMSADHVACDGVATFTEPRMNVPFTPPVSLLSGLPLRAFNEAYYRANANASMRTVAPAAFFFPLDAVSNWNRLYGPKGLHQHQCVVPAGAAEATVNLLMKTARERGHGSFLTVLKRFGALQSPGPTSFPQEGVTLTLDFAAKGPSTLDLLDRLDAIVLDAGGRTNPYKDSRMSAATYQRGFPDWEHLDYLRDPVCMSDFWRRVTSRKAVAAPRLSASSETVNHLTEHDFQTNAGQSAS